jgi:hypothetical protein
MDVVIGIAVLPKIDFPRYGLKMSDPKCLEHEMHSIRTLFARKIFLTTVAAHGLHVLPLCTNIWVTIEGRHLPVHICGRTGKEIATLETGSAWPFQFSFNLVDCVLYVMLAATDRSIACGNGGAG